LIVIVLWNIATAFSLADGGFGTPYGLIYLALAPELIAAQASMGGGPAPAAMNGTLSVAVAVGNSCVLVLAAWALARRGILRTQVAPGRDRLLAKIERKPLRLTAAWPLTWLLQRGSAPARPAVQACIAVPVLIIGLPCVREVQIVLGILLVFLSQVVAIGVAATTIAPERERKTWTCLLSTSLSGRRIVHDLLHGVLLGSMLPLMAGLALISVGVLRADIQAFPWLAAGIGASVTTWLVAITATLCASMVVRTTSAALVLGLAFAFARPMLAIGAHAIYEEMPGTDSLGEAGLVLVGSLALALSMFVTSRLRKLLMGAGAVIVILGGAAMQVSTVSHGDDSSAWFAVVLGSGIAGIGLAIRGTRRSRGVLALVGLFLALAMLPCILAIGMKGDEAALAMFSGTGFLISSIDAATSGAGMPIGTPLQGIVQDLLVLLGLGVVFLPRLERWLGRAA
jgi:hypothetical protein